MEQAQEINQELLAKLLESLIEEQKLSETADGK
jgi:hypothetical protein